MNTRVRILRKQLNISQEAFGAKLGVTGAGISKIESGQRNLTEQMIILICKEFNINENWLRYGKGEMFRKITPSGMDQLTDYYQLDELDIRIIQEYVKLDSKQRKVIKEYIMKVADACRASELLTDGENGPEAARCAEGLEANENYDEFQYGRIEIK
ncbi:MAG TPA: helix-turn-helix transcriptional regulator [Mobilitalea sp.]|nr:helix-turn-helix transcriptional regulator [Mobilitalea sp.]